MTASSRSPLFKIAIGVAVVLAILVLLLAMMPWGVFKGQAERALSEEIGAPVTIGSIERRSFFSFSPLLDVKNIQIAQPSWAGQGDLARIERLTLRLPVLPILIGRIEPRPVEAVNGQLVLIRDKNGRKNWEAQAKKSSGGGGGGLDHLAVRNLNITFSDAVKDRSAKLTVNSDAQGFRTNGSGVLGGDPVQINLTGDPIAGHNPWKFKVALDGARTQISADGVMASPFNLKDMTLKFTARAADLLDLDRVIEAGLFGTQPVKLNGSVSRKGDIWTVSQLAGTIGRSRLTQAKATLDKSRDRMRIDADVRLAVLDFDDLANDQGRAIGAARRARLGPRIIPGTKVDLKKLTDLDGVLNIRADTMVSRFNDPFRRLNATLTLDQARLTVAPFELGLTRGTLGGRVVVDQRDGRKQPVVSLDLTLNQTTIGTLAGGGTIDGPLRGMAKLTGSGLTIREAVGRSNGKVALVSGTGQIPANIASFLGLDVGRGATVDKDQRATLRCMILRMDVAGGQARLNPLLIDTSRSQSRFSGTINLDGEWLALSMMGSPKKDSILRLTTPVPITGTIKQPIPKVPGQEKSTVGGVLKMLGDAIAGDRPPLATDANCTALGARAMG